MAVLAWEKESRFGYSTVITVQNHDSLWTIAEKVYGDGTYWKLIYEENRERIGEDFNFLFPGTELRVTVP